VFEKMQCFFAGSLKKYEKSRCMPAAAGIAFLA